jgi:hypothetical protein
MTDYIDGMLILFVYIGLYSAFVFFLLWYTVFSYEDSPFVPMYHVFVF